MRIGAQVFVSALLQFLSCDLLENINLHNVVKVFIFLSLYKTALFCCRQIYFNTKSFERQTIKPNMHCEVKIKAANFYWTLFLGCKFQVFNF